MPVKNSVSISALERPVRQHENFAAVSQVRVYGSEARKSQGSVHLVVYSSAGFPPCALWDYSVKLYSDEKVSEACLSLQDRKGMDVNVLLFCVWVAASGRQTLTETELEEGMAVSSHWQSNAVSPLRDIRRFLKEPNSKIDSRLSGELRRVIVESELYAEKLELLALDTLINRPATGSFDGSQCAEAAAENLLSYAQKAAPGELEDRDRSDFRAIWQAAFPEENPELSGLAT